jgi:magnesium transporter
MERQGQEHLEADDLSEVWAALTPEERGNGLLELSRAQAHEFFVELTTLDQAALLPYLPKSEWRVWIRLLAPDDAVDLVQQVDLELRDELMSLLDEPTRREVTALLAYAEDDAGGLMSPRFARIRPEMTADEAIGYLRKQARDRVETLSYIYVLDAEQTLLGVVSFRELFAAAAGSRVKDIMRRDLVTVPADLDQEELSRLFARHGLAAIPVVDAAGKLSGIVTLDDIVEVVAQEATEDIHKLGGMEALATPYLDTPFMSMVKKRGGWLAALFLGELLTASAMTEYEDDIARAVVLALFVPLIISSGGNSGSQATTLIIRAMALGEVEPRDWWRIVKRELAAGLVLGAILSVIGLVRVLAWQAVWHSYGEHYLAVAITVAVSLLFVVAWGTISGSMLPFVIRRLGFDPASASAPFVATLVDVLGLVIYFNVAQIVMSGTLL